MEYVFAVEEPSHLIALTCVGRALPRHDAPISDKHVALVECQTDDVPAVLAALVGVRFVMAPLKPAPPLEATLDVCKQALYNHFSRRGHPSWWRSVDWFQAHKHEFRAGEHVVVRDAVLQHRTSSEKEHMQWLVQHGGPDTASYTMDADGQERIYRL